MQNKMLVGFIIAVIIAGAGSFYGGMLYGQSKISAKNLSAQGRQAFGANGVGGMQRNMTGQAGSGDRAAAGGFINGNIIAKDDKSVTVKLADGGSKIIFLSNGTQITKSVDGSAADLEVGKNVLITGNPNSDGSLTAQTVQLRPVQPAASSTPIMVK